MLQHNRTGEAGSSHNGPAGVTGQSCGNFAQGSSGAPVVVERWRIQGLLSDALCVWGGGGGNGDSVFRSHAASGFPTLVEVIEQNGQVHLSISADTILRYH